LSLINYSGKIVEANIPIFTGANRGYRYGDGFFETIRVSNGKIRLQNLHVKRVERSIATLQYIHPQNSINSIFQQAIELCYSNNFEVSAKVRLSFFNGNGSAFDENVPLQYLIEAYPLSETANHLNAEGITIGICADVTKSCDTYANLKSSNYLFSRMGIEFARVNSWDDALILNQFGNICESTIANIFWLAQDTIHTPPLSEGCVQGVMREYLMSEISVTEKTCTAEDLLQADEIFLTNATSGLRWVKNLAGRELSKKVSEKIYVNLVAPLWSL